jgi:hypothetical protein
MRALSTSELLSVWDRGLAQSPVQRALALLSAACPEVSVEALAQLSIGRRDAGLMTLREWVFGSQLVSQTACPACGERLELNFNLADIRVAPESEGIEIQSRAIDNYQIQFRLPNSFDLMRLTANADVAEGRQQLLQQCLHAVQHHGQEISADQLPAGIVEAVVEQMALADPQADVQLALTCPACEHGWQALFDIGAFFWNEINAWAMRVLREVHTLACAYGWREAEVLVLSPQRRQFYLDLVSQ